MTEDLRAESRVRRPRRRRRRVLIASVSVCVVVFAAITARLFIWPDLPPLPKHADAIIELGGPEAGGRDRVAIELAQQHRARFLIQSTVVAEAGTDRCLPAQPHVTVLCFHATPASTRGEAEYIGRLAKARHWTSVILVTTPDQAWRARLRMLRCFSGQVYVATTPLSLLDWLTAIPYQWGAAAKAVIWQRTC